MHIVVTGASSGIGRDLAKAFDVEGNSISLVARRRTLLEELQTEIEVPTRPVVADLANVGDPIGWLVEAEEALGPVDVLVNNAGMSYVEPTHGISPQRIEKLFQLNVHTPIAAIQHVLPAMLERGQGTIVNIASVAAFTWHPFMCHYHATKGALANFSESLRLELRHSGVNVVTVYPGPIHTPMADRNFDLIKNVSAATVPTGNTQTLAQLVHRTVQKKKARVIYPGFYRLAWWFPSMGRLTVQVVRAEVADGKTPLLPGDNEVLPTPEA